MRERCMDLLGYVYLCRCHPRYSSKDDSIGYSFIILFKVIEVLEV